MKTSIPFIVVILVLLGISGSGDNSINYSAAAHSSTTTLMKTAGIAGQNITVTKADYLLSTPLSSSIILAKTTLKESSTFTINMVVTNTGATTVTGIQPSSLDVNGTGWAALTKWPSPSLANLAPGKTVKFKLTYKAMLAGTVTLSGNAISADGNSVKSSSPVITIVPKKIGAVAVTDDLGNATLKSGKVTLPIQIQDEDTGSPIVGLSFALALDKKNHSRAVLAVADPLGRYPLQIIVLQGPNTVAKSSSAICKAVPLHQSTGALTIGSRPDCSSGDLYSHVILPLETSALPSLKVNAPPSPAPLSDTVLSATKAAMSSAMQQTLKATVSKTTISCHDALEEDKAKLRELPADKIVDKFIIDPAATAACAIAAPEFAAACPEIVESVGKAGDMLTAVNIMTDVFQCGLNPSDELMLQRVTLLPGTADVLLYQELISPEQTAPTLVRVPVSATDEYGQPLSTGSLEIFSQSNQGVGFRGVIDSGGAEVYVPLGDYDWTVRSQNYKPQCGQVSVADSNTTIHAVMQPQPVASSTATADQLTGFLPEGTQFTVTPHFFDANGHEVACSGQAKFYAHNPVGTLVATVDADTGIVTMQGGCGAAGITAWCNGLESRRLLVSTDCDGKLPPSPPTPKPVSGLPKGFPQNLPTGNYLMTYSESVSSITCCAGSPQQCVTTPGYSIPLASLGTFPLTNLKTFANVVVQAFNSAVAAASQPGCSQSVSYSTFADNAFTVTYTVTCTTEGCTGGIATFSFTLQKQ